MDLHEKQDIAKATIKKEENRQQKEQEAIAAVMENEKQPLTEPAPVVTSALINDKDAVDQHSL